MSYLRDLLPSAQDYVGAKDFWRHDVVAGVTVGIVALPLALAFGITTGAGARAGLITAIYAGVVAAIFGGLHILATADRTDGHKLSPRQRFLQRRIKS